MDISYLSKGLAGNIDLAMEATLGSASLLYISTANLPVCMLFSEFRRSTQKMKNKLEAGEKIDATEFPFIRFHLVEPTDPNVLQPQFYENARTFQESHKALVNAPQNKQKEMYTAYINQCINCHQTYCSGPLKRIRKLVLN